jgi:hypothetical protein
VVVLARKRLQDFPGTVSRDVIEGVNPVAEFGDAANCALDEKVLVADEDDADDLRQCSSVVQSNRGRTAPRT